MMLVSLVVKASLLLVLAAAIHLAIARRISAAARHLLWTLTAAALLLLPAMSALVPSWTLSIRVPRPPDAASVATATSAAPAVSPQDVEPARRAEPLAGAPAAAARAASVDVPRAPVTPPLASSPSSLPAPAPAPISWRTVVPILYAVGALLLLTRLAAECLMIRRLARQAIDVDDPEWRELFVECARSMRLERPVRLLRSSHRTMPMTFGTRRPVILLPAIADTWSDDRRRAVLLHELAHVARFDCLTQMMAAVACALYWMHPGVWWVARRLRVERELACDDRVLAAGTHARDYAGHLLEIAYSLGGGHAPALAVSMARPRQLEGRMLAVLDETRNRATPPMRSRLAAVAMAAALLLPLAGAEATVMSVAADEAVYPSSASSAANDADSAPSASSPTKGAAEGQERLPGTWEIRPANETGFVHLRISEVSKDGGNWSSGYNVAIDKLQGLSGAQLSGANGPVTFHITRDAGTFTFEGIFRNSVGAGTFTFAPNSAFPGELAKRGLARPTPEEQYQLARADVGFEFLDELTKQGYQRPDIADLVRAAQHGVGLDYLRDLGNLGYRVGLLDSLIKMRDHGVNARYIRELANDGFTHLSPDDLVRTRDHGVNADYMRALRDAGYRPLSLDEVINARDHGISQNYIKDMADLGHARLPLEEMIKARDHGLSAEYIRGMRDLGYPIDDLKAMIKARDHGISVEYVREMAAAGYANLPLADLIRARDHGVTAGYAQGMKAQGYDKIGLDDLIGLRDHGVTPERVRSANARAGTHLPLEMIKSLADGGGLR